MYQLKQVWLVPSRSDRQVNAETGDNIALGKHIETGGT